MKEEYGVAFHFQSFFPVFVSIYLLSFIDLLMVCVIFPPVQLHPSSQCIPIFPNLPFSSPSSSSSSPITSHALYALTIFTIQTALLRLSLSLSAGMNRAKLSTLSGYLVIKLSIVVILCSSSTAREANMPA